jgi:hypothetical protein
VSWACLRPNCRTGSLSRRKKTKNWVTA